MVVFYWITSLAIMALLASGLTYAQTRREPRILSGADIGFRVEKTNQSGEPVGTLMVRINGEWVAVGSSPTWTPAK
jgi:hypothetical protein